MSKELEALERIKNAPTIYVGCASDIYTRYSFECKEIEKSLKALEIIKNRECIFKGLQNVSQEEFDLLKEVLL